MKHVNLISFSSTILSSATNTLHTIWSRQVKRKQKAAIKCFVTFICFFSITSQAFSQWTYALQGGKYNAFLQTAINGNVGIGTSTPSPLYKLDVAGSIRATNQIYCEDIRVNESITVGDNINVDGGIYVMGGASFGGPIGIGTTSLNSPLTILGTGTNTDLLSFRTKTDIAKWHWNMSGGGLNLAETGVADYRFFIKDGGNVGIGTGTPTGRLNVYNAGADTKVLIGNPSAATGGYTSMSFGTSADKNGYCYIQSLKTSGTAWGDLILNKEPAGNVGIGTDNPTAKLHVAGSIKIQDINVLELGAGRTKEANAGKIGYETLTTGALDIVGAGTNNINRKIKFWTEGGTYFTGAIGIGTDNPTGRLNVYNAGADTKVLIGNPSATAGGYTSMTFGTSADKNGYCYIQSLKTAGTAWGDLILNKDGANVGIGTTNPSQTLEVAGNIKATKFIGDGSLLTGLINLKGADGATWLSGIENPPGASVGKDGDFYLNITSQDVFKKTAGAWGSALLKVKGDKGDKGDGISAVEKAAIVTSATAAGAAAGTAAGGTAGTEAGTVSGAAAGVTAGAEAGATAGAEAGAEAAENAIAGGDLSGTLSNAKVTKIQGKPIAVAIPSTNQVLQWKNNEWTPSDISQSVWTVNGNNINYSLSGNVGIGTTDPNSPLTIRGTGINTNLLSFKTTADIAKWHWNMLGGGLNLAETGVADYRFFIKDGGNVGIGTSNPGLYKLAVEGKIGAREVEVKNSSWADFVFNKNYTLKTLQEVEHYINTHKHLPDVPSEEEVKKNGINLGNMDAILLQKIEELTLYIIGQNKRIEVLEKEKTLSKQ